MFLIKTTRALALAAVLSSGVVSAAPFTISTSGTWGNLFKSDAYFVSNQPWTLTFQVASPPVILSSFPNSFLTTYFNATYKLNGNPVALTGNEVVFYPGPQAGGFSICFDANCNIQIDPFAATPTLFTGPTSSPTIVPGVYLTDQQGLGAFDTSSYGSSPGILTISINAQVSTTTPEPSTWMLTAAGLAVAVLGRSRRQRAISSIRSVVRN